MAIRLGKCTNFGNCTIADSGQTVQIPEGSDLVCPECKRALTETTPARRSRPPALLWIALAALLLLIGLGFTAYQLFKGRSRNEERSTAAVTSGATSAALRLCGSNTIGAQLAPALVSAFLKQNGGSDVRVTTTGTDESSVTGAMNGEPQLITIKAHGSATAFQGLGDGSCDIGMASRKIKGTEAQALSGLGDMTSPASEHVLGLDGIAVIVNRGNPVSSLTIQDLANLFSGSGGSRTAGLSGPLQVYARDEKSGTYDTFKTLVLGNRALASNAKRFEDSRALSDAVANDPNGIGFVGLPYIGSAKAVAVSEPGTRALLPNKFTVSTEDYLLSRRLYLYTSSSPKPLARRFIDFALSKAGQDVVAENGFVEQNVRVEAAAPAPGASPQYQQITRGAQRLSLDFRFRTGSSQLDNKALVDTDRVTSLLSDLHYTGQNVLLLGFADSTGSSAKNVVLSKDRSKAVADNFGQRGITPGLVTGFGADMPVASNDTEEGRQKNRRVEIWIKK